MYIIKKMIIIIKQQNNDIQGVSMKLLHSWQLKLYSVLVFPWTSLVSCLACSEQGWWDFRRFRPGALIVVTVSCSVCWSSASARRDKANALCVSADVRRRYSVVSAVYLTSTFSQSKSIPVVVFFRCPCSHSFLQQVLIVTQSAQWYNHPRRISERTSPQIESVCGNVQRQRHQHESC